MNYIINIFHTQEIAIGILANLSCHNDIGSKILLDQELTTILVNLLSCDDSQTIKEIIRLLDTLIHTSKAESCTSSLLNMELLWTSLAFILQNSMNGKIFEPFCIVLLTVQFLYPLFAVFFIQRSYYADLPNCSTFSLVTLIQKMHFHVKVKANVISITLLHILNPYHRIIKAFSLGSWSARDS